jgi:hypothetical protein
VQSRSFGNERIYSLGREAKVYLEEGISYIYPWIEEQVKTQREFERNSSPGVARPIANAKRAKRSLALLAGLRDALSLEKGIDPWLDAWYDRN